MTKLSWDPVPGTDGTYCSPACGRGCTKDEYIAAHQRGLDIRADLGQTWRVEVFENLGWHVKVTSADGRLAVRPELGLVPGQRAYWASLGEFEFSAGGPTPNAAVANVVAKARRQAERLAALVEGL